MSTHEQSPAATPPAGIGLRPEHYRDLVDQQPDIGWVEVHSENYFGKGGAPLHYLAKAREHYPVSLHGVGLSLGSSDDLSRETLTHLKRLVDRYEPFLVSDHLSFCSADGRYLNDLVPIPYTEETLDHVAGRIRQTQDFLGRRILIENPSSYLAWRQSRLTEWEFLAAVAERADCDILLDVNNIFVSSQNLGYDASTYLGAIPRARVREIHLAGHSARTFAEGEILIDTHDCPVSEPVWALFRIAASRFPGVPTLIERDANLPSLSELVREAKRADAEREGAPRHVAA